MDTIFEVNENIFSLPVKVQKPVGASSLQTSSQASYKKRAYRSKFITAKILERLEYMELEDHIDCSRDRPIHDLDIEDPDIMDLNYKDAMRVLNAF